MALRPADVAVNVLVAAGCHDGPRAIKLAQQRRRFLVDVTIQLLSVALAQPRERAVPGRIVVDGVEQHRRVIEQQVHELFRLRQHRLTEEGQRPGIRPVHIRASQWQLLPDQESRPISQLIKPWRLDVGRQPQHVHAGLPSQIKVCLQELLSCRVQKKFGAIARASDEDAPGVDRQGPSLGASL